MNIAFTLDKLAQIHPHRLAIVERKSSTTYRELSQKAATAAAYLDSSGVKKGDIVLLYLNLSSELYALILGINRIGAVVLFIDPTYGPKELEHCIRLAKPKAIVVDDRLHLVAKVTAPFFSINKVLPLSQFQLAHARGSSMPATLAIADVKASDPALITFTSGSSGLPKGISRSHGFLTTQSQVLREELAIGSYQSELTTLPIFVLANLASGVTSILPSSNLRSRFKLKKHSEQALLAAQLLEHMPERILAAPAFLVQIASYLKEQNIKCYFVREVLTGGGPVFPQLLALLHEVFPHARLISVYGSTEAEPIAHVDLTNERGQTVIAKGGGLPQGKVSAQVDLAILPVVLKTSYTEAEFNSLRAPTNVIGEIVVAGEHVIEGYIAGIGDSENKIRVGGRVFHRTGDAGYLDSEGRLFLMGRAAMKVSIPGGSVYSLAVEASAMATGLVASCAYLVVNDKRVLVAKLGPNANDDKETEAILMNQLGFAGIDKVVIRASLPMDKRHGSKILYNKLKGSL